MKYYCIDGHFEKYKYINLIDSITMDPLEKRVSETIKNNEEKEDQYKKSCIITAKKIREEILNIDSSLHKAIDKNLSEGKELFPISASFFERRISNSIKTLIKQYQKCSNNYRHNDKKLLVKMHSELNKDLKSLSVHMTAEDDYEFGIYFDHYYRPEFLFSVKKILKENDNK